MQLDIAEHDKERLVTKTYTLACCVLTVCVQFADRQSFQWAANNMFSGHRGHGVYTPYQGSVPSRLISPLTPVPLVFEEFPQGLGDTPTEVIHSRRPHQVP